MKFFEDIHVGDEFVFGTRNVLADDIKSFAAKYDPQPFHLDEDAAARSHFGALCASGWQTGSMWIRAFVDYWTAEHEKMARRGDDIAPMGPSPGFDDMVWHKPVYAGDDITFCAKVLAKRALQSKPDWGLVTQLNSAVNQNAETVMTFTGKVFVRRRLG